MKSDKAIKGSGDDKLERGLFVNAAVSQISNISDTNCYVIGIYGRWGSGKTSIIELMRQEFKKRNFYSVYFNPWNFSTKEALMIELFKKIYIGIRQEGKNNSDIKKVGKFLKRNADYLSLPKLSFGGAEVDASTTARGLFKGLGNILDEELELEEQKDEVNQVLRTLDKPLIIFIDDVDRLDKDEIKMLFKIIKQNADFDNIRYVLSLDEEMVAKSLGESYGSGREEDGKRFLEKIVQLPIRIPELSTQRRVNYTLFLFSQWEDENNIHLPQEHWNEFINKLWVAHDLMIFTPRDSKRLINAVSFIELSLREEVNILDLILVESFRLFNPKLYQYLINNKRLLFGDFLIDKNVNNLDIYSSLGIVGSDINQFSLLIDWLFPHNTLNGTEKTYTFDTMPFEDENNESRKFNLSKNQNIGSKPYFYKYLEFIIGENQIPDKLFRNILTLFSEKEYEDLSVILPELLKYSSDVIFEKFDLFESELNEFATSNLLKLYFSNPNFRDSFDLGKSFKSTIRNSENIVKKTLTFFKSSEDDKLKFSTLEFIVKNTDDIFIISNLLQACLKGYKINDTENSEVNPYFKSGLVEEVADRFIVEVLEKRNIIPIDFTKRKIYSLIALFELRGKSEELKMKLQSIISSKVEEAVNYLKSIVSIASFNNWQDLHINNEIKNSEFEYAEKFVHRNLLQTSIEKLFPDLDLSLTDADQPGHSGQREPNESVAIQYLRYVQKDETQQKLMAKIQNLL